MTASGYRQSSRPYLAGGQDILPLLWNLVSLEDLGERRRLRKQILLLITCKKRKQNKWPELAGVSGIAQMSRPGGPHGEGNTNGRGRRGQDSSETIYVSLAESVTQLRTAPECPVCP